MTSTRRHKRYYGKQRYSMAEEHEIESIFHLMLANYGYFQREKDAAELATLLDIWKQLLTDIGGDVLKASALQHISESKWFPSVAELREISVRILCPRRQGAVEAWGEVVRQFHIAGYYGTPEFTDPVTAEVVAQLGWRELCQSENQAADRARFIEGWNALAQREKADAIMLPQVRDVMLQLAESKRVPFPRLAAAGRAGMQEQE